MQILTLKINLMKKFWNNLFRHCFSVSLYFYVFWNVFRLTFVIKNKNSLITIKTKIKLFKNID